MGPHRITSGKGKVNNIFEIKKMSMLFNVILATQLAAFLVKNTTIHILLNPSSFFSNHFDLFNVVSISVMPDLRLAGLAHLTALAGVDPVVLAAGLVPADGAHVLGIGQRVTSRVVPSLDTEGEQF